MIQTIKLFSRILKSTFSAASGLNKKIKKINKSKDIQDKTTEIDKLVAEGTINWGKNIFYNTESTISVKGLENIPKDKACVFIANHQGYMDIPVLLGFLEKSMGFIAKIEILKVPVLSKWMKYMHCTFLDRKSPRQSIKAMNESIENVKKGYSIVIFPEGTRSKGGKVKDFKAGSFKLAYQGGVPIVPISIDGTWKIFEEKKRLRPSHVNLTIHPLIETANLSKEERQSIPLITKNLIESSIPAENLLS